ncbi:MAG: hypothetical protein GEU73_05530 [Chloroflexi bacterium]|nr:hypothetical protein [Chloroflexota bacterium]
MPRRHTVRSLRLVTCLLMGSLVLAACGRADAPGAGSAASGPGSAAPQRSLVMVASQVPTDFAAKGLAGGVGAATGVAENIPGVILNAALAIADERARVSPYLAESLPQLNSDSWQLFPDGTMETTYRLKPNLVWHDGQPLTAEDFAFAWEVYATPEYGVDRSIPIRFMSSVAAPDPRTVVIQWRQPWADAGILQGEQGGGSTTTSFPPLPRHILEDAHLESTGTGEGFLPNNPFWNANFVGAGPYKLDSYNPGVSIEGLAFKAHILGRPRIDRVSIRAIADVNTALAATVAGEVDFGADLFRAQEGLILERDWADGVVLWEALGSRTLQFQLRPDLASPPEIATDVRVRQAIAHAIDKRESFDAVTGGRGIMSDTRTHPGEEYHPLVDREVTKYPHDPRRTQQLLEEAGFTRSSTGRWLDTRGEPAGLPIWFTGGSSLFEQENAIIADQLKQFGFEAIPGRFPSGGSQQDRAQLPGMLAVGSGQFTTYHSANIPGPETRWAGGNRGGYSNPELDRLLDLLEGEVVRDEIVRLTIQIERLVSSELPGIFLYWHSRAWNHVNVLKGPTVRQVPKGAGSPMRNIHEWYWEP